MWSTLPHGHLDLWEMNLELGLRDSEFKGLGNDLMFLGCCEDAALSLCECGSREQCSEDLGESDS